MAVILTRIGNMEATISEDSEEILALCRSGTVDLVLMDVALSKTEYQGEPIDGVELTKILKADPATAHIPVVLITAHAMRGDRERLLAESGAEAYIAKPLSDHRELLVTVRSHLPGEQAQ